MLRWEEVVEVILTAIISGGAVSIIIQHYMGRKLEKKKYEHSKNLQIDSFFRGIGTEELLNTFKKLLSLLNLGMKLSSEDLNELIKNVFLYGSPETIKEMAYFQQFIYLYLGETPKKNYSEGNYKNYVMLILYVSLLSKLKFDFTGYSIEVTDILKMKLNDYYNRKAEFSKALELAKKFKVDFDNNDL